MKVNPAKLRDRLVAMRRDREMELEALPRKIVLDPLGTDGRRLVLRGEIHFLDQLCDAIDASMENE